MPSCALPSHCTAQLPAHLPRATGWAAGTKQRKAQPTFQMCVWSRIVHAACRAPAGRIKQHADGGAPTSRAGTAESMPCRCSDTVMGSSGYLFGAGSPG